MAAEVGKRAELSDFLRSRRARLSPADVGIVAVGQRRTPGLRREEVAMLAGVGVSWYTWLEQGRSINVSPEVLDAIGRALRLTVPELSHLYLLAGLNPPPVRVISDSTATPQLRRIVDAWHPRPAIVHDQHWNLIAVNDATRQVFGYDDTDHNCLISFFTHTRYRSMQVEWAAVAPSVVAAFRADAARYPGDPEFDRLVGEVSAASSEFADLWSRHDVDVPVQTVKAVRHPVVGELYFDKTTLVPVDHPDWSLELYDPRPGTAQRVERLLSLVLPVPG
ncbi:transcriptional regulator [Actinosynnema sp. ALI-1.44]|uniref:helix-turn-helix transcriptional regulator n=1 Tax=Actinosynnema sp. ALI-1.44 TaxID=1933779 RepID=UPI00097C85B6|nr:helix-turn-helix transcriptional regulator [Actinosynnema sp. ALI-1.44]ONI73063.1 transcriptional regulator [Actinosynnema sp. ALI-1.44]